MELLLNLAWLGLSTTLVWRFLLCARGPHQWRKGRAIVALALLILILLPAISMTDDLAAFSNPGEINHVFRRDGTPLQLHSDAAAVAIVALLLDILAISVMRLSGEQFKLRSFSGAMLDGAVRSLGLRPPPVRSLFAA